MKAVVVGLGLAGSEAAWQLAEAGVSVRAFEMRPKRRTEAHKTDQFAEMVCSNSFGSDMPGAASKILKDELEFLGAMVLGEARKASVPAGGSLAVDRDIFAQAITAKLSAHPNITIAREEIEHIPEDVTTILATGPLTSPALAAQLEKKLGGKSLYFYDAISPIISADSLDMDKLFFANRWNKGETPDFLNLPLTQAQYEEFVADLLSAEVVLPHDFEEEKYFEGCMPIEAIAARGPQTLAFGPMKPAGLPMPGTDKWAHAILQLRTENKHKTAYNLVGCQTKMKYGEQQRVFRKLPGLENAEFLRLGSMHRNTYIDSPRVLAPALHLRSEATLYIAGQLTGTEGYLESSATGLVAGRNAARFLLGQEPLQFPPESMLGCLLAAITDPARENFQPLNANLGILPPLTGGRWKDKKERNERYAARSREAFAMAAP